MKQFFKFVLASCLGIFLFVFVLLIVGGGIGLSSLLKEKLTKTFKDDLILVMNFDSNIPEKTNNIERSPFEFGQDDVVGIHGVLQVLEHAAQNEKIKGMYIKTNSLPTQFYSNAKLLRDGIEAFKESGKFVYAYGDYYTQGGYYLASVADSIFLNPIGGIDLRGLGSELLYFKDMLDKIGVEPEVYYAGKFKSATEPFRRNDMSDENRIQVRAFLNEVNTNIMSDIAESRGITLDKILNIMNNYSSRRATLALNAGLIDGRWYKEDMLGLLKTKMGVEESDDLKYMGINKYYGKIKPEKNKSDNRIAVVMAEGQIVDNSEENGVIDGDRYAKIIRDIREDEDIKGIVLRVNSGGGSVLASDKIYHELELAKEDGKKVVVSMGDFAASGGYYISCHADSIFAQENTITGSIGVFGLLFNTDELFNEKLGIHIDTVKTGKFSAMGLGILETDEAYAAMIQEFIDTTYLEFKEKVAKGRNMSMDQVEEIAQGRVWTGHKGLELGLVDRIGDMQDAITSVASLAEIEDYKLSYYPKIKDPLERFMKELTKQNGSMKGMEAKIEELFPQYAEIKELKEMNGTIQARIPFKLEAE